MDSQNSNKRTFEKFEEGIPENSQASDKKKANLAVEHTCDQEECECCGLGEVELDEEAIKDMTARELFEAAVVESKHLEKAEFPVLVKLFETALEKYENAWESEKIKLNDPKNVDCEKIKTVELGIEYLECKNAFFEFLRTVVDKPQLIEVIDFIQNSLNEFSSVSQNKPEKEILQRISLGKLKFYGQKFKTEVLIELVENEKWKLIDESDDEADSEEEPENMIENASQLVFNNDEAVNTQDFKIPSIKDFSQQKSSCMSKLKFYGQKFKTEVLIELVENEKWKLIDESDDEADSEEEPENMIENASQLVFNNDEAVNTQDFKIPSIKDFSQQKSSCMSSAIIDNLVGTMSAMLPEDVIWKILY
ncbi:hypothetical protein AX774_g2197 [Zancudomyces culisetae]|uniref:Uncharacterized protein n=1 Tax=Zancudomyces culisetae TaxID=1213189 RepID=A0A1R1PTL0_ZANCU|nr:hypothetical protein AX774_g2197 [Zancudomyces culisetae]|eukprot:OMH84287.1 hypothetical protein AX774_g2197 [Zancudomyces culisetae]